MALSTSLRALIATLALACAPMAGPASAQTVPPMYSEFVGAGYISDIVGCEGSDWPEWRHVSLRMNDPHDGTPYPSGSTLIFDSGAIRVSFQETRNSVHALFGDHLSLRDAGFSLTNLGDFLGPEDEFGFLMVRVNNFMGLSDCTGIIAVAVARSVGRNQIYR